MDSDVGVSCQHLKVSVGVKDLDAGPHGDSPDQTIDQLANRLATSATRSVERGRQLVVGRRRRQHRRSCEQPSELRKLSLIAGSGKQLHGDRVARREFAVEEAINGVADR